MIPPKNRITSSHILISRTDNIGDVVLTLPLVACLKQINPGVKISFLCRAYAAPLARLCDDIDNVVEVESVEHDLRQFLRHSDIDTVILAQPNRELAVAAFFERIQHRVGNARQKLYQLLYCNRRVRFSKGTSDHHESQINFEFLRPYGETRIPPLDEIPGLFHFTVAENEQITQMLQPHGFNLILHLKSNGHGREWPHEHFLALANSLRQYPDIHIWLTGSAGEGDWIKTNATKLLQLPNVTSVCGQFSVQQLMAFIKQADGLIASGTGPLHMSAAIGQRTLGLFPQTRPMHAGRWAAVGRRASNLNSEQVNCNDCTNKNRGDTCDCMWAIKPQQVSAVVQQWQAEERMIQGEEASLNQTANLRPALRCVG